VIVIAHRRNLIDELVATPVECGVEVDIRSYDSELVIHHEPFNNGVKFSEWIKAYRHKTLILNVKEEGLEDRLLCIMAEQRIDDFFFLDQSFPFLIKTSSGGERRCAVRVSEFESVQTALSLSGKIEWIWLDCFAGFRTTCAEWNMLKERDFKICLVSPELQGRWDEHEILATRRKLLDWDAEPDAVCTKLEMREAWLREL